MSMLVPQTVGAVQRPLLQALQVPQQAHLLNHDLERNLARPGAGMETIGLTERRHRTRTADDTAENSDSSPTLTPSSSRDDEHRQEASRLKLLAHEIWNELVRFKQQHFPRKVAESVEKDDELKHERVDDFPEGLPQLAAYMDGDDTFTSFRRFGRLSIRLLLHGQIELCKLEKKIDKLDNDDAKSSTMEHRLRGYDGYPGWDETQRKLIDEARAKYIEYADLLVKFSQVRALNNSTKRNHMQLVNWVINNKPLAEGKDDFIFRADDFVSPARNFEKDRWFEDRIETWLDSKGSFLKPLIKEFLQTGEEKRKTEDEYVDHYSSTRLAFLGNSLVVLLTAGGIALPVLLLVLQSMHRAVMTTVALIFVFFFSVSASIVTGARILDLMFGTAAQVRWGSNNAAWELFSGIGRAMRVLNGGQSLGGGPN